MNSNNAPCENIIEKWINHFKNKEFVKFIFVGIINTIFGYGLFALLIFMHVFYVWAVLWANIIGVIFSYNTFGKFVFKKNKNSFVKFITLYIFLYFLNIGIITLAEIFIKNVYISGFLSMLICASASFLFNKYYVFRGSHATN